MRPATTLILLATLLGAADAAADVPGAMTFQGFLSAAGGEPISGPVDLEFRIYDQESGGAPLWQEAHAAVAVSNGLFSAVLGLATAFPADLFGGAQRWLAIAVDGGDEMAPRQPIAAVPYALEARRAAEADNAALLDGHAAADFAAADHTHDQAGVGVDFSQKDEATQLQTAATEVTAVEISAPSDGWVQVVMQGQFNVQILFGSQTVTCEASISTDGAMNADERVTFTSSTTGATDTFSRFALIPVPAGDTTFYFVGKGNIASALASCSVTKAVITAMFVPNRY